MQEKQKSNRNSKIYATVKTTPKDILGLLAPVLKQMQPHLVNGILTK